MQKLFRYNFLTSSDELIADFQMDVGDSILINVFEVFEDTIETYMYLTDTNKTVITATDTFYNCYSFYYDSQEVYDDEMSAFYAPNLGLVLSVMEGPVPLFQTLIGAHIGGVDVLKTIDQAMTLQSYKLSQNYPNPFNPTTTIQYELPQRSDVKIMIYDLLGRKVTTLINQTQDAGFRSVTWNATNDHGKPVSAGVYLYQIQAGDYVQTRKMVLFK